MTVHIEDLELDVREIVPRERHPLIFRILGELQPGQALVVINDHDPAPLGYQIAATRPNQYGWHYREQGPEVWQVSITRLETDLAEQTVASIVERYPEAMGVFQEFGIDLCCGGSLSVTQAATSHGHDVNTVVQAVQSQLTQIER